jgi:excisionase family DNA binding protein
MDQQQPALPELLGVSVAEALRMIGGKIGRSTLYDAIKRGELASVRFGSRIIIPVAALRRQFGVGQ